MSQSTNNRKRKLTNLFGNNHILDDMFPRDRQAYELNKNHIALKEHTQSIEKLFSNYKIII